MSSLTEISPVVVAQPAHGFVTQAIMSDNTIEENFDFFTYKANKNAVLFFYPMNFTFVCPTELIALDKAIAEFEKRNTLVATVSVDSHFSHLAYKNTPIEDGGIGNVHYVMLSDISKSISKKYGVLHNDSIALRGTFIIDESNILRHITINDLPLGRNINEILRILDAISHHKKHGEVCPANWKTGEKSMVPNSEGVKEYLNSECK